MGKLTLLLVLILSAAQLFVQEKFAVDKSSAIIGGSAGFSSTGTGTLLQLHAYYIPSGFTMRVLNVVLMRRMMPERARRLQRTRVDDATGGSPRGADSASVRHACNPLPA
ncbi:MAG: hypothetical protein ACE5HO_04860 [bacterium]